MELKIVFGLTCFLHLLYNIAGTDVITFNLDLQEKELEEDIGSLLQHEQFIQVVKPKTKKPVSKSQPKASLPQKLDVHVTSKMTILDKSNISSKISNPQNMYESKRLHLHKPETTFKGGIKAGNTSWSKMAGAKRESNGLQLAWEDLSMLDLGGDNEEDYLTNEMITAEDEFSKELHRSRRVAVPYSGFNGIKINMTLTGTIPPGEANFKQGIISTLKLYLEIYFKNSHAIHSITVTVYTKINTTTVGVEIDVIIDDEITRKYLASALHDLDISDKFTVNGNNYRVSSPYVEATDNGALRPAICFLCETYQRCDRNPQDGTSFCRIMDSNFFSYGAVSGDRTLPSNYEDASAHISIESSVPFGSTLCNSLYISVNGLISFEEPFTRFWPQRLPAQDAYRKMRKLLTVYWTDLDLLINDRAKVYYHLHSKSTNDRYQLDVLKRANIAVITYSQSTYTYDASSVLVVTWEDVPPYPADSNKSERVTFQCVFISDGVTSYALYIYGSGAMHFDPRFERQVEVGYGSTNLDSSRKNYNQFDRVLGNTGVPGLWFLKIGEAVNSRAKCMNWFNSQVNFISGVNFWNSIASPCPCSEWSVWFSSRWLPAITVLPQEHNTFCYDSVPLFGSYGRRCCYRQDGSLSFENRQPKSGSLQRFSPYIDLYNFILQDALPKKWCCYESNMCPFYYFARPGVQCVVGITWRAFFFGDPHITTLDSRTFIFNGLGEYRLLEVSDLVQNVTRNFKLNGRTCKAKTVNGTESDATVFCGLALQTTSGEHSQVTISPSGNAMVIYVNTQDFTNRFKDDPTFKISANGTFITRVNDSLRISTPDLIGLTITLKDHLLDFSVEIDRTFRNMTKGLMGNFNNNSKDDFILSNGTQLPDSATERQLFAYGKTWEVPPDQTLFRSFDGRNITYFPNSSFVPLFLDEADPALKAKAEKICRNSTACIFDYLATGNAQVAQETLQAQAEFDREEDVINNQPPKIEGAERLNLTVGESQTLNFMAFDPNGDRFTFLVIEGQNNSAVKYSNSSSGNFSVTVNLTNLEPVAFQFVAVDSKQLQSEVTEIEIAACPNCSDHGLCDFTHTQNDPNVLTYSVAKCVCDDGWTGPECRQDRNGCQDNPCGIGSNCTDLTPEEEARLNKTHNCTGCFSGFEIDASGTKCLDINECNFTENPCGNNSVCVNTFGNYNCICERGYRINNMRKCIDINECVEHLHTCNQICINTPGSYRCECEQGFTLDNGTFCNKTDSVSDPCAALSGLKCQYGCRNESNVPKCFCEVGSELASDKISCKNIDECQMRLCAQDCTDSEGSYSCSCFPGYKLGSDGLSCDLCEANMYGTNCSTPCNCRGRATACDNVKGCLCESGWTGPGCEFDVDECEANGTICPHDQNCVNTNGSYECVCPEGYVLVNGTCEDIDECNPDIIDVASNCSQVCSNTPGSYSCSCYDGYILEGNLCEDIDECDVGTSGCEQECVNKEGSFNCACKPGYRLTVNRKTCEEDPDETSPCSIFGPNNGNCSHVCQVVNNAPVCSCRLGYQLASDGKACENIDECSQQGGNKKCSDECVDTIGSYECKCPIGKNLLSDRRTCQECDHHWGPNCSNVCGCNPRGTVICDPVSGCECIKGWTGSTCYADIDECSNSSIPCSHNANCMNTAGSYACICKTGYVMLNGQCVDIDECKTSSPCDQNCINTDGSYLCSCFNDGFLKDGNKCIDIDECARSASHNCQQRCRNTHGNYTCECFEGYTLNGITRKTCDPDLSANCTRTDCTDFCSFDSGVEICKCRLGYQLESDNKTCSDIDECYSNPCNGSCSNTDGGFNCTCPAGTSLAADKLACQACDQQHFGLGCSGTCNCNTSNTQRCEATDGSCVCQNGWQGNRCDIDVNECIGANAVNCGANAVCENMPGSYRCVCNSGFYRTNGTCQDIDECTNSSQHNCVNPWACSNTAGSFICVCSEDYIERNSQCEDRFKNFTIQTTLVFRNYPIHSRIFDNTTAEFRDLAKYVEEAVQSYGIGIIYNSLARVRVNYFRNGSVIADTTVVIDALNSPDPPRDAAKLISNLALTGHLNSTMEVQSITIGGKPLPLGANECDVYKSLENCPEDHICSSDNGKLQCQAVPSGGSNTDLIIGLAVGIPLFVILTFIIALLVFLYIRRKQRHQEESDASSHSIGPDAPIRSVFAGQIATKGSWGTPQHRQMYSPDRLSSQPSSISGGTGNGRPLKAKRAGPRSDFIDSPWYEDREASSSTPRMAADSRGATAEAGQPTSNFSWEYMFRLLEPHVPLEIQRPNVAPTPNPTYMPKAPDQSADFMA